MGNPGRGGGPVHFRPRDLPGILEIGSLRAGFAEDFSGCHDFPAVPHHLAAPGADRFITGRPGQIGILYRNPDLLDAKENAVRHALVGFELLGGFSPDTGSVMRHEVARVPEVIGAIFETCLRLAVLAKHLNAVFIVNDHPDIALAVDADGVHLGQDDLPAEAVRGILSSGKIIGVSTHNLEQARAARSAGADYIGFRPLFPTRTKDAGPLQGIEGLRQVRKAVTLPVIAIGGITIENVGEAITAGADGIAVISSVLSAPDLFQAARDMVERIESVQVP